MFQISKWILCDKHGWPVEKIIGRPITNLIRCLLHGRRIRLWEGSGDFVNAKPKPPEVQPSQFHEIRRHG